jgi:hypothetical protein
MPQVQTETEEREAVAYELAWLCLRTLQITGELPRAIRAAAEHAGGLAARGHQKVHLDVTNQSSTEIAALCAAIRAECPAIRNVNPWQNG